MHSRIKIASRTLKRKQGNSSLEIILYKPEKNKDDEWSCRFKIGNEEKKAHGIDSMQAMLVAIDGIRRNLLELKNIEDIDWIDGRNFLGFPLFVPMYLSDSEIYEIENTVVSLEKKILQEREKKASVEK